MSRGDVTPLLGNERFTLTHPFYSPRSLCSSIQKSTRSRTAYLRGVLEIAAKISNEREGCAAYPSSILILINSKITTTVSFVMVLA